MFSRASKGTVRPGKGGPSGLSFIGKEVTVKGDLTTTSQLHVDGRIDGDVRCGSLCQGESGIIAGNISADQVRLAGLVDGTVSAQTVVLEESARITGDVSYETISVAAGAQVDGRLSRRPGAAPGDRAPTLIAAAAKPETIGAPSSAQELFAPAEARKRAAG